MKCFHPLGLALAAVLAATAAKAEVQKFMNTCDGKLCPYYQIVLTPPDGWVIDKEATRNNKVQVMVPKGKSFGNAPALIYVQVFYHRDKQQTLANFAETSNARWRATVKDAKIRNCPRSPAPTAKPGSCVSVLRIRATSSSPTRWAPSASIPIRMATNSCWTSS